MQVTRSRPKIVAVADGLGVVGHAGARLLADIADATGLTDPSSRPDATGVALLTEGGTMKGVNRHADS